MVTCIIMPLYTLKSYRRVTEKIVGCLLHFPLTFKEALIIFPGTGSIFINLIGTQCLNHT